VGCEIDVLVKDNNIVRIDGANLTGVKGPLCVKGRFEQLYRETPRISTPFIADREGVMRDSSWEEAFDLTTKGLSAYRRRFGARSIAGFVSSLCPNETLEAFNKLMRDSVGTSLVDTLDGSDYRTVVQGISTYSKNGQGLEMESPLESILESDCVLVVGASPLESHPVAGCYMLRSRTQNQAQLLVIDPQQNDLGVRADLWLRPTEDATDIIISALAVMVAEKRKPAKQSQQAVLLARAAQSSGLDETSLAHAARMLNSARKVVVVYGNGIISKKDPGLVASLLKLAKLVNPDGPRVISLKPRGNSRGAWELGLASRDEITEAKPKLVYILQSDDEFAVEDWLLRVAEQAEFLIVQASYASPLTAAANVVFPSPIWAEREGTYFSLDGTVGKSQRVLEPPVGVKDDLEIIAQLAQRLKKRRLIRWLK